VFSGLVLGQNEKSRYNLYRLLPLIKDWFGKIWVGKYALNFYFKKNRVVKWMYLYAKMCNDDV